MLVALGVTGGIGAYKAVEVARGLQKRGHDVVAIMTHQDREELDRWLLDHQATRDDAGALRAKVLRGRGTP